MTALATVKPAARITLHRDGTVTLFDCIAQSWRKRVHYVPNETLVAMPEAQRRRIIRHLGIIEDRDGRHVYVCGGSERR